MGSIPQESYTPQALAATYPCIRSTTWAKIPLASRLVVADAHAVYKYDDNPSWCYAVLLDLFKLGVCREDAHTFTHLWCQNGSVRSELQRLINASHKRAQNYLKKAQRGPTHVTTEVLTPLSEKALDFCTLLMLSVDNPYTPFSMGYAQISEVTGVQRDLARYYVQQLIKGGYLILVEGGKGDKKYGNRTATYRFREGV
jgi:hypothetical protein